jgi:hypothetical protein
MKGYPVRLFLLSAAITILSCTQLEGVGVLVPVTETPQPLDATPDDPPVGPTPEEPGTIGLDFGDAPDPSFPSLLATDGARAVPGAFWLGELAFPPTTEIDAKVVDQDELDDGMVQLLVTPGKVLVTFQAVLAESSEVRLVYFNLLADVNRDGRWQAFQGQAGTVQEWAVVNRELSLNPGESQEIATEFPSLGPGPDLWFRATLTSKPVEAADWSGTGLFEEGEIEDYRIPPGTSDDWNFDCEPDPLVLFHGETGEIGFVRAAGVGGPNKYLVVGAIGPLGLFGDPFAEEIDVQPAPDPNGVPQNFPDVVTVKSLEVHGPSHSKAYEIVVRLKGPGRVETEKCLVEVIHWNPWQPVGVEDDRVVYDGPPQVRSGGTLRARFQVTDVNGRPAQGEFFATLGEPPGDKRASHASGQLDAEGWVTFELPVNWPPGLTVLHFSWRGQVFAIAQIEVLP